MARIIFGGGVTDMRGSVGGTVFSRNASGAYARARVQGVNPATPAQLAQRALTEAISQLWRELSSARRQAWALYASQLGAQASRNQTPLTGQQAFMRNNLRYAYLRDKFGVVQGQTYLADPPAAPSGMAGLLAIDGALGATSMEVDEAAPGLWEIGPTSYRLSSISNPGTGFGPFRIIVEAAPPFSAGRSRPSSYASLFRPIALREVVTTLQTLTDEYRAVFPHFFAYTGAETAPEGGLSILVGVKAAFRLTPVLPETGEAGAPLETLINIYYVAE